MEPHQQNHTHQQHHTHQERQHRSVHPLRRSALRGCSPHSRTIHLVDIENLVGHGRVEEEAAKTAAIRFVATAGVTNLDHVLVASDAGNLMATRVCFPGCSRLIGRGPNGADDALLAAVDPTDLAHRFSEIVIGSGDGAFAGLATACQRLGMHVVVVARPGTVSRSLLFSDAEFRPLDSTTSADHQEAV